MEHFFLTLFFSLLSLHTKQPNCFFFLYLSLSLSSNLQTLVYLFAHSLLKNAFFFFFYYYFLLLIVMHFIRILILTTCHKIKINFYWFVLATLRIQHEKKIKKSKIQFETNRMINKKRIPKENNKKNTYKWIGKEHQKSIHFYSLTYTYTYT